MEYIATREQIAASFGEKTLSDINPEVKNDLLVRDAIMSLTDPEYETRTIGHATPGELNEVPDYWMLATPRINHDLQYKSGRIICKYLTGVEVRAGEKSSKTDDLPSDFMKAYDYLNERDKQFSLCINLNSIATRLAQKLSYSGCPIMAGIELGDTCDKDGSPVGSYSRIWYTHKATSGLAILRKEVARMQCTGGRISDWMGIASHESMSQSTVETIALYGLTSVVMSPKPIAVPDQRNISATVSSGDNITPARLRLV